MAASALDTTRRGRPRDAQRDVAIMQAVLDLVGEVGLGHVSMDAVAARAGAGKATIYRRWRTKEALVVDAWRTLIAPTPTPDTGTLRGDLEAVLGAMIDRADATAFDMLSQIVAAARNDAALSDALREWLTGRRQPIREVLARARRRGEVHDAVNLEVLEDVIVAPFFYRLLLSNGRLDRRLVRQVLDTVLGQVATVGKGSRGH